MVAAAFNGAEPIDENSPTDSSPRAPSPVKLGHKARMPSDATTIRPTTATSNPFATPTVRSRSSSIATAVMPHIDAVAALRPDPGTETDFKVENNPFAFSPGQLNKLLNPKSLLAFRALGGLRGIERGLQTDTTAGLSVDETNVRSRISFDQAVSDLQKSPEGSVNTTTTGEGAFADRCRVYGKNVLPSKKATPLYKVRNTQGCHQNEPLTDAVPVTAYVERLQ